MAKFRILPRVRRVTAITSPKAPEMSARRAMQTLVDAVEGDVGQIVEWMKAGTYEPIIIANALQETLDRFESINTRAMAEEWVTTVDILAKHRLSERIQNALGVPTVHIFDDENVRYAASMVSNKTAGLIKDVPREYIQNVADAALQSYRGIPFPEGRSLTQQIMHLNNMTRERARFIARHQTSVINTAVNQARQTSVGIEEYFWSTANDARVVGNPGGINPDVSAKQERYHGNHWERDYRNNGGKAYRWNEPFADGLPGEAFRCRCVALPKIDSGKMKYERFLITDAPYSDAV